MARVTGRPRKTVSDWLALPDDVRAELIEGEILVTPTPTFRHQEIVGAIHVALASWLRAHGKGPSGGGGSHGGTGTRGKVVQAPIDVHLPTGDVVQPDVVYVAASNLGIVADRVHGAPDLLVEVVSASHPERDLFVKRDLYARSGVPEYWIVRPEEAAIEVLRLAGARYEPAGYFRAGSSVTTPAFPGLALAVDDVFRT